MKRVSAIIAAGLLVAGCSDSGHTHVDNGHSHGDDGHHAHAHAHDHHHTHAETASKASSADYVHDGLTTDHIKSGAAVRLDADLREPLVPGDSGAFEVTVREGYREGSLTLIARAGDGLSLLTTGDRADFDTSKGDTHAWTIYFDTETAGRYYIYVSAIAETPGGRSTREFALPVQVGKASDVTPKSSSLDVVEDTATGERLVMMQAEETIRSAD